jgi:hypothetical protein
MCAGCETSGDETVADDHRDIAGARESLADEALLAAIASLERAAVDREDDRRAAGAVRDIDVEAIFAVGVISVCDVVDIADGAALRRATRERAVAVSDPSPC